MGFFEDVDALGIVEGHVQRVLSLEETKAKAVLSRYKEIRQELRDRLDRARAGSFTAQQTRGVLTQVEAAITAITGSLKKEMKSAAYDAALQGVSDQLTEIKKFESHFQGAVVPINLDVATVAEDTSNFLLNQYDSSLDSYGQDLITQMTTNLTQAALMEMSYGETVQKLGQFFIGEEWKLHRIVRTELHNVYNIGKLNGMDATQEEAIPDLMKTLYHRIDSRTGKDSEYAASKHLIAPLDEPFRYKWKGKERVFMAPPDRPNDRAILIPYRAAWGKL
jgi:hypothetical protein